MSDRQAQLKKMYHCLNTPEGKVLVEEFRVYYDQAVLFDTDPLVLSRNVAQRDVFKMLESLQRGDGIK